MKEYTIEDLMDRSVEIEKVCSIVRNLSDDENTCIAIDGNWGCGKTHVMNILQGEFEKDGNNIVIKYDAWENNYYDDPLITILYCILDKLKINVKNDKVLKKIVKATLKEAKKDWDATKNNILDKMAQKGKDSANFKIALACCLIEKIISIGKSTTSFLLDNAKFADFQSYQSLLNDTKDFLNGLTKGGNKIIFLVDEVDRCLPDQQLIILERLHHLFQVNNSAVIVALNKDVVVQAYMNRYCVGHSSLGNDYLKKFFEYEIDLQDKEYVMLSNYLVNYLKENIICDEEKAKILVSDIYMIISKIRNRSGDKIKLDARNIKLFREKLNKILEEKSKNTNIEYLEFWLTVIMLYIKMFNSYIVKYQDCKNGKSNDSSFFDININLGAFLDTINKFHYRGNDGDVYFYNIYKNVNFNIYQYLLNLCCFRNHNSMIIAELRDLSGRKEDFNWIDSVFESIDRYYV